MTKILIAEGDSTTQTLLVAYLSQRGYAVLAAANGREAVVMARENAPDLIMLDLMMPGMDGWQAMAELRRASSVPVIFLTALDSERDVARGLELGADDYLRTPFSLKELGLRVQALLRRTSVPGVIDAGYRDERLEIDLVRHKVTVNGEVLHLTPTEFRLLAYLVRRQDRPVAHAEALREVWGPGYVDAPATLHVYIRYLREKIEEDPKKPAYIRTQWGVGYLFCAKATT